MTERVVIGQLPSTAYGIRVSKPGYSALTAATDHMMLDSDSGMSRVLQRGTITFPAGGAMSQSVSLPWIGGYAPFVVVKSLIIESGVTYAFPFHSLQDSAATVNGWTTTVSSGGTLTVTRNFSSTLTVYVAYFTLAQRGGA